MSLSVNDSMRAMVAVVRAADQECSASIRRHGRVASF